MRIRQVLNGFKLPENTRALGRDAYTRDTGLLGLPLGLGSAFWQWWYYGGAARFDALGVLLLLAVNVVIAIVAACAWGRVVWAVSERNYRAGDARHPDSGVSSRWR